MAEVDVKSLTVVDLFQKWMSTRNPLEIGTQFIIKNYDKIITLVASDGYPRGKFIDEDGEDFDIAKNPDIKFVQILKDDKEGLMSYYNEDVWEAFDTARNGTLVTEKDANGKPMYDEDGKPIYKFMRDEEGHILYDDEHNPLYLKEKHIIKTKDEKKPLILQGLGKEQRNELYHDVECYDVTKIIDELVKDAKEIEKSYLDNYIYKDRILKYLQNNNYPILTKDLLYFLFRNCDFLPSKDKDVMIVKNDDELFGYVVREKGRYMFVPRNMPINEEYSYEQNQALGFYYTADSYLDIALETIKDYSNKFIAHYQNDPSKNKTDLGYQASSTIKTLLAFSCECYLKSLLINNGMNINELKDLGHSLVNLFASLDGKLIAKVFDYMKKSDYKITYSVITPVFEASDLTEKFMIDLARNDNAFEDARYSAEFEKNTDYSFLSKFALALRHCSNKEYMTISPFTEFIEANISKKHFI